MTDTLNYYNEHDPFAASWLRELIKAGQIPKGYVDERSIEDVQPRELNGFVQCHFFAGIGGWSYALKLAGWPEDRPVWTGSCPCQPFSAAGKRKGTADERHLWPSFFHLIQERRPETVFGEQVEAAIIQGWLDLVQTDLEGSGYRFAPQGIAACNLGAPHIRKRLYFVADSEINRHEGQSIRSYGEQTKRIEKSGMVDFMADSGCGRQHGWREHRRHESEVKGTEQAIRSNNRQQTQERGAVSNIWANAEWINCLDDRKRAIEPGTFPLAHGVPARVGRLRGYGNAIVPQVAAAFIENYLMVRGSEDNQ
jgi:DNA (cytosine-5)-methyltransferase 1